MQKVTANGVELAVYDRGQGTPILFVHGFPLDHTMWQPQLDEFSGDYRVIAPDLRGFGESSTADGPLTMQQHADDLNAVLDALGVTEPVVYCGLSMGGYIAWPFIEQYASRLRALILCDTRAVGETTVGVQMRKQLAKAAMEFGLEPILDAMLPRLFAEVTVEQRPEVVEQVREMMLRTPPEKVAAGLQGMSERADSTELLPKITLPTLLLVGVEDKISTVDEMRGMAEAIPGAEFAEIEDAGHVAPLENPAAVNFRMREFLAMHA